MIKRRKYLKRVELWQTSYCQRQLEKNTRRLRNNKMQTYFRTQLESLYFNHSIIKCYHHHHSQDQFQTCLWVLFQICLCKYQVQDRDLLYLLTWDHSQIITNSRDHKCKDRARDPTIPNIHHKIWVKDRDLSNNLIEIISFLPHNNNKFHMYRVNRRDLEIIHRFKRIQVNLVNWLQKSKERL